MTGKCAGLQFQMTRFTWRASGNQRSQVVAGGHRWSQVVTAKGDMASGRSHRVLNYLFLMNDLREDLGEFRTLFCVYFAR